MRRINAVEQKRQILVVRNHAAVLDRRPFEIGLLQAFTQSREIAHGRDTAIYGAGAHRYENAAMLAKFSEHMDVVLVGAAAFHEPDIDEAVEFLLVVQRRFVEIDKIDQLDDPLVDVEERHVASEAAGERAGG